MDLTPVVDVPKETTSSPTAQALTEEPLTTTKVPEYVIDDTQFANTDLPFHIPLLSVDLIGTFVVNSEPLN